jgi:aryl-alcohol dehydrogenase-like predicted oxidoreductase
MSLPKNPSRRDLFKAGVALGAGFALSRSPFWLSEVYAAARQQSQLPLITKKIPSTGEILPVIGVGTNRFNTEPPELVERLRAVIKTMPTIGTKVIDTANQYGRGNSERVIGQLTQEFGIRNQLFIATKLALRGDEAAARAGIDQSFASLQTDRIDLYFVHNMAGTDTLLGVLKEYKQAGKIKYIGCSISSDNNYETLEAVMRSQPLDFIEIDYSITNTNADEKLLALAMERGMAVLNNVPFNSRGGQLVSLVEGKPLPEFAADINVKSWAQYFLKYNVSHPAITCAIPGTTRVEHLMDNNGAARGVLPDAAMRQRMLDYFKSVAG